MDGPRNNKIDCMFFPCTNREQVIIDEDAPLNGWDERKKSRKSTKNDLSSLNTAIGRSTVTNSIDPDLENCEVPLEPEYLSKPTIIMCNPNAMYY